MVTKSKPVDEPDLFSMGKEQPISRTIEPARKIIKASKPAISPELLPKNLSNSLERLSDQEFQRLIAAVLEEQERRSKGSVARVRHPAKQQTEANAPALTVGKLNAVRAAVKAGVKPNQIAKQFGLTQSQLRAALKLSSSRETIS